MIPGILIGFFLLLTLIVLISLFRSTNVKVGINQTINQYSEKWCDCKEATEVGGGRCLSCGKRSE